MPKGGKNANAAPILDDADVLIDDGGTFSYQAMAIDPDPMEKLGYSFLVDGKQRQTFTADNGVVFMIDKNTGQVDTTPLIPYDPDAIYTLTIAVEDRFKVIDLATVRLSFPPCTEYSIDNGRTVGDSPELINAGTDAFCFTTDVRTNTFAGIAHFTSNDRIVVSGVASVDDLNFTTGLGGGADDLYITFNSTTTGTVDIIVLGDVITTPGIVLDYASAVAAIGFDFLTIAPEEPCTEYSIDIGSVVGSALPVMIDAGTDAFCFATDVAVDTFVEIANFTNDDEIIVSALAGVAELNFATGTPGSSIGDEETDLVITYNNTTTGTLDVIVLDDVITNPGVVSDYATAVAAVGYHFLAFA